MATVNNWLGFSLSPQELPPSQTESTLMSAAATDNVSGDVCFNIPQGRFARIVFYQSI
jgi:AP2-like factor, ANT lineage